MAKSPYHDPRYREIRKRLLAGSPVCSYCGTRKADTIDHIIEVDAGGDHTADNCVPACYKCNAAKGARYGNAKRAAATRARNTATQHRPERRSPPPARFLPPAANPDPPMRDISQKKKKPAEPAEPAPLEAGIDLPPRLETPGAVETRGEPPLPSYGPAVAAWAARNLGVELMPWQRRVLDGQLAHDGTGRLRFRQSLVSVARQNGKTVALKALVGWWLTEGAIARGGPQTVITTAHALDLAVSLFQDLAPVLEEKFEAKAKWSYGRNELRMADGSVWLVRAATPSAGHGRSPDLVVADEIWDISEEVIDQGLLPAQRARKSPLLSMWSTAGTEASRAMLRWREQGVQQIDAGGDGPVYLAEWSPPPGVDVSDPKWWTWANPALGHTLDLETLIAESKSPNRTAFLRASLNLWVAADAGWLEPGIWDRLVYDGPALPPAVVLAIDSSQDGSRHVGVLAYEIDGRAVLDVAFVANSESEMWDRVAAVLPPGAQLAVTPGLDIHTPKHLEHRKTTVGYGELVKWTALVRSMILEGRVMHTGASQLSEHIGRAVAVRTQAGLVLSSQKSAGPIELARCAVWAAALATRSKWKSRPAMATSRR